MNRNKKITIWLILAVVVSVPIVAAANSPLLAWRDPVYIAAGFSGIIGLALLLVQPLLISGYFPGISAIRNRQLHRFAGALLVLAVIAHVTGLWVTSPPDVIDVLLFRSPTPFSIWGVVAMWALFATALIAVFRQNWQLRAMIWRTIHLSLVAVIVTGTVVHAWLIIGTMETITKAVLCLFIVLATANVFRVYRFWKK